MAEFHKLPGVGKEQWAVLALFLNVKNAGTLRLRATQGEVEASLLDPTLLASPFHVLCAVNKAAVASEQNQMKTRTIFSEIIYCLSPSSNISDSFKKFGVKDTSRNMLVVLLQESMDMAQLEFLTQQIEGESVSLDYLSTINDTDKIIKDFKITQEERNISTLENAVVTRLTIKEIS